MGCVFKLNYYRVDFNIKAGGSFEHHEMIVMAEDEKIARQVIQGAYRDEHECGDLEILRVVDTWMEYPNDL